MEILISRINDLILYKILFFVGIGLLALVGIVLSLHGEELKKKKFEALKRLNKGE